MYGVEKQVGGPQKCMYATQIKWTALKEIQRVEALIFEAGNSLPDCHMCSYNEAKRAWLPERGTGGLRGRVEDRILPAAPPKSFAVSLGHSPEATCPTFAGSTTRWS
ncbi:hypothetical protein TNCV_1385301 [Trichonephila clavipes]|nr:hypothetical protein TNCV_1385301 [Trichonephila clavipes]